MKKRMFVTTALCLTIFYSVEAVVLDTIKIEDSSFVSSIKLNGTQLTVSKVSSIRNIVEMVINNNRLFVVFERPDGMGQTFLESYTIDTLRRKLVYECEYGKRASGSYLMENPTLCLTEKQTLRVADAFFGDIYDMAANGNLNITKDHILTSPKVILPYPISKTVSNVFSMTEHQYCFCGRQPAEGPAVLLHATVFADSLVINEILKPIYKTKYSSWIANFGNFAYSHEHNTGVYAYLMYPAIEFFSMDGEKKHVVRYPGKDFNPNTLKMGDTWDLNPSYNVALTQSNGSLYTLFWGKKYSTMKMEAAKKRAYSWIIRYGWDGKPVKIYSVNKMLMCMAVNQYDDFIIAYDGHSFWYFNIPR